VQPEAAAVLLRQEEGHVVHRERVQQPLADAAQRAVEIHLRSELAREAEQRAAVVEAVAVEDVPVELLLDPVAQRLEDQRRNQHQQHHGRRAEFVAARERIDQQRHEAQHRERGQQIDVALLEDDVDVHQPVAQDRVGPGERDEAEKQHAQPHRLRRRHAGCKRQGVGKGEGHDAGESAVAEPLQLLAHDRVGGLAEAQMQRQPPCQIAGRKQRHPQAVNQPVQLDERNRAAHDARGEAELQRR